MVFLSDRSEYLISVIICEFSMHVSKCRRQSDHLCSIAKLFYNKLERNWNKVVECSLMIAFSFCTLKIFLTSGMREIFSRSLWSG